MGEKYNRRYNFRIDGKVPPPIAEKKRKTPSKKVTIKVTMYFVTKSSRLWWNHGYGRCVFSDMYDRSEVEKRKFKHLRGALEYIDMLKCQSKERRKLVNYKIEVL